MISPSVIGQWESCLFTSRHKGNYTIISIMILNARVKMVARTFLAAASSSLLSAVFHFSLAPLLAPRLALISRPAGSFPWWAPATVKLIESILLSTTNLSNGMSLYCVADE